MDDARYARYLKQLAGCAALLFLAIPVYVHCFPMNFLKRDYAVWSHQIAFASTPGEDDPAVLILGDSRVQAAIIPKRMGASVRSLAFGSATPADTWLLFERYLENHRPPRALLVAFAPFHLLEPTSHDLFWVRTVRYKLWPIRDDLALIARARELGVPLVDADVGHGVLLEWLLHRFNYPGYYVPALRNARLWGRRAKNRQTAAEIEASRGHLYYGASEFSHGLNRDVYRDGFAASPLYDAYLRDLLTRASAVGSRVLLTTMPMNASSFEALEPGFVADYEAYLEVLAADFPEASIQTRIRSLPDDHFGDEHHLNSRGAERVTDEFAALLQVDGAPDAPATELAHHP
jgi:hypothetical protein